MNSLHRLDTIKSRQLEQLDRPQAYCFPEIPVKTVAGEKEGKEDIFYGIGSISNRHGEEDFTEQNNGMENLNHTERRTREIEELAYSRGFKQGEMAGMEWGKKKVAPVLDNFHQALLELARIKEELYHRAEKEAVTLALAVARKIIQKEVNTSRETILNIIKEALKKVMTSGEIKIRVRPCDLAFVKESRSALLDAVDNTEGIIFEEDSSIREGGCIIETDMGEIDARIDRQIQIVEELFKSQMDMSGPVV